MKNTNETEDEYKPISIVRIFLISITKSAINHILTLTVAYVSKHKRKPEVFNDAKFNFIRSISTA